MCIPDQIKLIDYDNKKIASMKTALFPEGYADISPWELLEQSKNMRVRLESLLELMVRKKQGSIRFEFGRDWSLEDGKFDTLEEAANLTKVPYGFYLSNKRNLFERVLQAEP